MRLLRMLILLVSCIVIIHASIEPNNDDHFLNQNVKDHYNHNTIKCTSPHCHIICDRFHECKDISINSTLSQIVSIACLEDSSCQHLNIIAASTTNKIEITCDHQTNPCVSAEIQIENSKTTIQCDGTPTSSSLLTTRFLLYHL